MHETSEIRRSLKTPVTKHYGTTFVLLFGFRPSHFSGLPDTVRVAVWSRYLLYPYGATLGCMCKRGCIYVSPQLTAAVIWTPVGAAVHKCLIEIQSIILDLCRQERGQPASPPAGIVQCRRCYTAACLFAVIGFVDVAANSLLTTRQPRKHLPWLEKTASQILRSEVMAQLGNHECLHVIAE